MAVRVLGCPVRFFLTAGQAGDAPQAQPLIEGLSAEVVMGERLPIPMRCDPRSPQKVPKPSFRTTPHGPSNIHLTNPFMPSVISSNAASRTEALQARRYTLRKNGEKLFRRRRYRRNFALAKITVHTA